MVITFDGTTSSGKSSIAKELGKQTNICFVSTGYIYRAITKKCLNLGVSHEDDEKIKFVIQTTSLDYHNDKDKTIIKVDGLIQTLQDLKSPEVSNKTPLYASKEYVREYVREIQKSLANKNEDIIVEGRDIGSVVFPGADFKFYVDADLKTRAERRFVDYINQGKNVTLEQVIKDVQERDNQDQHRTQSPLIMTSDAILIDTSDKTVSECVNQIKNIINDRINEK